MTPPNMTQDESNSNSEVFLGPTGSETEEFYGYQRQNPGKDKSEYLKWFQDRFHKEIELRRRRSDQPSDLEYMVIKKRSKYRERIGEESTELIRYAEMHPQKTYRELSEWFTDRFGKEIDITAISRALKRSRQEIDNGDSSMSYDASPQAKRGRRSLGSPPKNGSYSGQQQHPRHRSQERPSMGSFSVASEISRNSYSPNNTPRREHAKLPTPEEPSRPPMQHYQPQSHPPPPQPLYSQVPPPVTQGPVWTSVNSAGTLSSSLRAPSSNTYDPRAERSEHPPLQPAPPQSPSRMMRTPSMSSQSASHGHQRIAPAVPPPLQPRPSAFSPVESHPGPPASVPAAPPMAPRPYSPRKDMAMHLQARFTAAIGENQRSMDEIRSCQAEMVALIEDRNAADARFMQEKAKLLAERDRLKQNNDALRAWGNDLQNGNLELQQYQRKYDEACQHIAKLEAEKRQLHEANNGAAVEIQKRGQQLANARAIMQENGLDEHGERLSVGPSERRSRKELDDWVINRFKEDSKHEDYLKTFVDGFESAGLKDLTGRVQTLKGYLTDMSLERERRESEWKRYIGSIGSEQSPVLGASAADDAGSDADDEGDGGDDSKKDIDVRQSSSKPESVQGASTPLTDTTNKNDPESTEKMDVDS